MHTVTQSPSLCKSQVYTTLWKMSVGHYLSCRNLSLKAEEEQEALQAKTDSQPGKREDI